MCSFGMLGGGGCIVQVSASLMVFGFPLFRLHGHVRLSNTYLGGIGSLRFSLVPDRVNFAPIVEWQLKMYEVLRIFYHNGGFLI